MCRGHPSPEVTSQGFKPYHFHPPALRPRVPLNMSEPSFPHVNGDKDSTHPEDCYKDQWNDTLEEHCPVPSLYQVLAISITITKEQRYIYGVAGEPVSLDSWGLGSVGKEHTSGVPKNTNNVVSAHPKYYSLSPIAGGMQKHFAYKTKCCNHFEGQFGIFLQN